MIIPNNKTVLIIAAHNEYRAELKRLIESEGFATIVVSEGMQGLVRFYQDKPDLVLLDYCLTGMSGIDACHQIKALSSDSLVPVIMFSKELSDHKVAECIKAGADDIVLKPFSLAIIRSKIHAMLRIRDERQSDEELAEQLFSEVVEKGNIAPKQIKIFKRSAETFSGDVQLTARCPNGNINILLGDFTGHGLSSAIGAVPLSDSFRVMTGKGYGTLEIIRQINRKMHRLLPTHMFLATAMVTLSFAERVAYVWNAGMEDILVFDKKTAQLKSRIGSFHPPLGISAELINDVKPQIIPLGKQDRIITYSDGIVEARNQLGAMFGEQRLIAATQQGLRSADVKGHIIAALEVFCEDLPQEDDVSLLDIDGDLTQYSPLSYPVNQDELSDADFDYQDIESSESMSDLQWSWQMKLVGEKLARVNPVPIVMNQLQEIEGTGEQWDSLYTVLTELYINALDHGVLRLNSDLKQSPAGFAHYFAEKERRLEDIGHNFIKIKLQHHTTENGGVVFITLADSGDGFEFTPWVEQADSLAKSQLDSHQLSGRGINLVRELCRGVTYLDNGTAVKAVYAWTR